MTQARQSYAQDRWPRGAGEQRPLPGAAAGEVVATIPARGPHVAAMLGHYLQRTAVQGHPGLLAPGAEGQS